MTCSQRREELAEAALGVPASDDLRTHLRECPACAAELQRHRALAQRMDDAVNLFVRREPPSHLPARTIAALHGAHRRRRWTGRFVAVGAALAASIVVAMLGLRAMQPAATRGPGAATLAVWRSPTGALLESRGSILRSPLRDVWFDAKPRPSHSQLPFRGSHGA